MSSVFIAGSAFPVTAITRSRRSPDLWGCPPPPWSTRILKHLHGPIPSLSQGGRADLQLYSGAWILRSPRLSASAVDFGFRSRQSCPSPPYPSHCIPDHPRLAWVSAIGRPSAVSCKAQIDPCYFTFYLLSRFLFWIVVKFEIRLTHYLYFLVVAKFENYSPSCHWERSPNDPALAGRARASRIHPENISPTLPRQGVLPRQHHLPPLKTFRANGRSAIMRLSAGTPTSQA